MRARKHYVQEHAGELAKMPASQRLMHDLKVAAKQFVVDCKTLEKKFSKLDSEHDKRNAEWKDKKKTNKWMPDERMKTLTAAMKSTTAQRYVTHIPANTHIHDRVTTHAAHAHTHVCPFAHIRQREPN